MTAALRRPEFIARQSGCPSGLVGRLIGTIMARETSQANTFAVELLDLQASDRVLEVGFGHGATLTRMAAAVSDGFVAGVDPSAEMCRMASKRNREGIQRGRVEVREGRAEALPFPDCSFDKALSVHTLYFWPDLLRPFGETRRVLRPGGRCVIAYRADAAAAQSFPGSVYRFRDEAEVCDGLRASGFADVRTYRHEGVSGTAVVSLTVAVRE